MGRSSKGMPRRTRGFRHDSRLASGSCDDAVARAEGVAVVVEFVAVAAAEEVSCRSTAFHTLAVFFAYASESAQVRRRENV